jgi:sigma-B regulation protein RsbU (phosphoserine phosphatase)
MILRWIRRRLAAKLALAIVVGALVIDAIAIWDLEESAVEALRRRAEAETRMIAAVVTNRLEAELTIAEGVPVRLAASLRKGWIGREAVERELCAVLEARPTVFGSAVVVEAGVVAPGAPAVGPYCYRGPSGPDLKDLATGGYDLSRMEWYRIARDGGTAAWTEPYLDEGGGEVLMVTRSVPIRMERAEGERIVGVATADVALDWLDAFVRQLPVAETGYAFLVGPRGRLLGHPATRPGDLVAADEALMPGSEGSGYRRAIQEIASRPDAAGESPLSVTDPRDARPGWLGSFPLGTTRWHTVLFFPERDQAQAVAAFRRRLLVSSLLGGLSLAAVVALLARSTVRPVTALARATRRIARGELDAPLPAIRSVDEVGRLAESFGEMQRALVRHVEQIRSSAAEQERLESELRIASQIQISLIPSPETLASRDLGCDVHGLLDPARAVGGDLFDVARRDSGELCFFIGDVSDKGIPAALLMGVTHTLFQAHARETLTPDAILAELNVALAAQNEAGMFVTAQCGVLDPRSGRLALSTAGHPRPVLLFRDGKPRFVEGGVGTILGIEPGLAFERVERTLEPGEALVLYTDGVTEAHNPQAELFDDERLLACLDEQPAASAETIARLVREAVRRFSDSAPQFDDIAILVIRRPAAPSAVTGPGPEPSLEIAGEVSEIARASRWLQGWCAANEVPEEAVRDLDLALDELLANVIDHGVGGAGPIRLRLSSSGGRVRLEIRDRGVAFDPRQSVEAGPRAEDGEGGLGLALVRGAVDALDYSREDGENRVLVERRLKR